MKLIKSSIIAFFLCGVMNAFAQSPSPAVWLKMDDIAGNGTITNYGDSTCKAKAKVDKPVVYADGERGNVLSFLSTSSKISLFNSGYIGVSGNRARTYSMWIKPKESFDGSVSLVSCAATKSTPGNPNFVISIPDNKSIQTFIGGRSKSPKMRYGNYFSSDIVDDASAWHMISIVYEADTIYAYKDGQAYAKKHYCEGGLNTELKWVVLFDKYLGYASDFRIYEAALTPDQIQQLFTESSTSASSEVQ